jgi:hypothetical protein
MHHFRREKRRPERFPFLPLDGVKKAKRESLETSRATAGDLYQVKNELKTLFFSVAYRQI